MRRRCAQPRCGSGACDGAGLIRLRSLGHWMPPVKPGVARRLAGRLRVLHVIAWTLAVLLAVELAAQVREQLLSGHSILNRVVSQPDFVRDERSGMWLLRPNAVIRGQQQEIRSNSLGLRSPELAPRAQPGEHRIAVIGASSVMGAYSPTNADTLPAVMEAQLRRLSPRSNVRVINAGIAGYTLLDQRKMLDYVAERLAPELVFVYSGVNDFTGYCRAGRSAVHVNPYRLPQFELPRWLMSVDLLLKNTVALRPAPRVSQRMVDARALDLGEYRRRVEDLVQAAQARGIRLVLATNARSYRPNQPLQVQEALARTARYYNDCFDLDGLNALYERHNAVIDEVGARLGVPVIAAGELVPGGTDYFVDSVHFTAKGKAALADLFSAYVLREYRGLWMGGE